MPVVNSLHIDKGFNNLLRRFLLALYQSFVVTEPYSLSVSNALKIALSPCSVALEPLAIKPLP